MHRGAVQKKPNEFLFQKRTFVLQIFSLIDSLQPILAEAERIIESSKMEFVKAGLDALIEKLKIIDSTNYAIYIVFFTRKLDELKTLTSLIIPLTLAREISEHLNMFKISNQNFLTQTMRSEGAFTTLIPENLATNLTQVLQRTPKPADSDSLLKDWVRDDFANVNGESFNLYKKHFPQSTSPKMIKNFCMENGLNEIQTSFVLSQAHQHAIGGLLAYVLDPFRNKLYENRVQYSPSFINGNMISIKARSGQLLVINCRAILYVKNLENTREVIPLLHIGYTVSAHNLTRRYPEILVDSELVHGNCFVPTIATIKLQFAFIDKIDSYGLQRLFRETVICGENHIAKIEETFLPPTAETSFMFDEPALVPLILDREF